VYLPRQTIAGKIIIALEAATSHCEQLINIGVYQVGRPNPERGRFITKYFLVTR
jgi:hypothetical protein